MIRVYIVPSPRPRRLRRVWALAAELGNDPEFIASLFGTCRLLRSGAWSGFAELLKCGMRGLHTELAAVPAVAPTGPGCGVDGCRVCATACGSEGPSS